ncbi:MAG: glycosyltransferase family 4 protein [Planctomycetes bacterium]|nr:glycosyltransferase family 4 protein [Planctomycetota bacterium]
MFDRKLNIVFVSGPLGYRGTSACSLALAAELAKRGHKIYAIAEPGPFATEFQKRSIPVTITENPNSLLSNLFMPPKLAERVREFNPHLIHGQSIETAGLARKLALKTNVPYIFTAHNMLEEKQELKIHSGLLKKIIAISEPVRESLVNHARMPKDLIKIVPVGVDLKRLKPSPPFTVNEYPVIGAFGPLEPVRGIEFLLKAAKEILKPYPNMQFLIVGEGPEEKKLKRLVRELDIVRNVTFCPETSDIFGLLMAIDVYVVPSLQSGLGVTILEAMACAKPVIATAVGGTYYLIKENETGLLVPKMDHIAIRDKLLWLIDNPESARNMGAKARGFVEQNFNAVQMADLTLDVYYKAIDMPG